MEKEMNQDLEQEVVNESVEMSTDNENQIEENVISEQEKLTNKILELESENAKLKNEYAKAYADTENIRKRLNNEAENARKYRIQSFALDILPVIDNLERALNQEKNDNDTFKKGIEMIYQQLIYSLKKEGVEEIEALNLEFDPNFHQALMTESVDGIEPNKVIEILQKGYKIKDRILRAAMVKVSE